MESNAFSSFFCKEARMHLPPYPNLVSKKGNLFDFVFSSCFWQNPEITHSPTNQTNAIVILKADLNRKRQNDIYVESKIELPCSQESRIWGSQWGFCNKFHMYWWRLFQASAAAVHSGTRSLHCLSCTSGCRKCRLTCVSHSLSPHCGKMISWSAIRNCSFIDFSQIW